MTCVAVIVVLLVVPVTSAVLPLATALADADLLPFSYVVDDVSFTVTFWPADVISRARCGDAAHLADRSARGRSGSSVGSPAADPECAPVAAVVEEVVAATAVAVLLAPELSIA